MAYVYSGVTLIFGQIVVVNVATVLVNALVAEHIHPLMRKV